MVDISKITRNCKPISCLAIGTNPYAPSSSDRDFETYNIIVDTMPGLEEDFAKIAHDPKLVVKYCKKVSLLITSVGFDA